MHYYLQRDGTCRYILDAEKIKTPTSDLLSFPRHVVISVTFNHEKHLVWFYGGDVVLMAFFCVGNNVIMRRGDISFSHCRRRQTKRSSSRDTGTMITGKKSFLFGLIGALTLVSSSGIDVAPVGLETGGSELAEISFL